MASYIADFESTTDPTDCRVWAYAICEVGNKDNIRIGTTIDDFMSLCRSSVENDLIYLGVKDAFDSSLADFSNMTDKSEIYVSDALHKANIDFSEKGVKAAAATVIYITEGMALEEEKPIEININKPFMYIIRDKETNEMWFIGTVYKPNLWENDKADYDYR